MDVAINEELAEEIGWHIGDGSMNYYNYHRGSSTGFYQLRGHIEDDKQHYIERIKPIFDKIYRVSVNLREMPSTRVFGFQIWNNDIVKFKQSLGLPLGKKFELQIPRQFTSNKKLLSACIRGIFDTDGGLYLENKNNKLYPRVHITTISNILSNKLVELFKLFNLRATINVDIRKGKELPAYRIETRGIEMLHKFFNEIVPKNPKHIAKYEYFKTTLPKT